MKDEIIVIPEIVTDKDTEQLDSEIESIRDELAEKHFMDNDELDELENLITKAMILGELYERKKWQDKQGQNQ